MLKRRNAQNMSIAVIIAAVIGLIVLVVIMVIFGKESADVTKTLERCEAKGGDCLDSCGGGRVVPNAKCDSASQKCCIKL